MSDAAAGTSADGGGAAADAGVDMSVSPDTLLTIEEFAAVLRVSVRTVRRLHDQGKLPAAIRIGTALRWSREAIEAWIQQGGGVPRRISR